MSLKGKLDRFCIFGGGRSLGPGWAAGGGAGAGGGGGAKFEVQSSSSHANFAGAGSSSGSGGGAKFEVRSSSAHANFAGAAPAPARGTPAPSNSKLQTLIEDLPLAHVHGDIPLAASLSSATRALARLSGMPELEALDLDRALYFDTETTGLGGQARAFLIGFLRLEGEGFQLRQLYLSELDQEPQLLQAFSEALASASFCVSYNGRSFDWPLLQSRYVMARLEIPKMPPHLDLYLVARRLYRHCLASLKLGAMEEALLGFRRARDLPGAAIPGRFFSYLASGDPAALEPVLEHHRHDLLSLPALLSVMAASYADASLGLQGELLLSLARIACRAHADDDALAFLARLQTQPGSAVTQEGALLAARLLTRQGRFEAARACLHQALRAPQSFENGHQAAIQLALAKLEEHRFKDPHQALQHAAHTQSVEGLVKHRRRQARLQAKQRARLVACTPRRPGL